MANANEILKEHVTLDIECMDRLYLNGYIPQMQTSGGLVYYLGQKGFPIPSPVILGDMTTNYRKQVKEFAEKEGIPLIEFEKGQRKDEVVAEYRQAHTGKEGVVVIGVAQEKASAFKATKRTTATWWGLITAVSQSTSTTTTFIYRMRNLGQPSSKCAAMRPMACASVSMDMSGPSSRLANRAWTLRRWTTDFSPVLSRWPCSLSATNWEQSRYRPFWKNGKHACPGV